MSSPRFETFLARLYTHDELRMAFLRDRECVAAAHGLNAAECDALARIDADALNAAAQSYACKRASATRVGRRSESSIAGAQRRYGLSFAARFPLKGPVGRVLRWLTRL